MYSCSEAFKTCFMGFGRQIELSATVDGVLYNAERIESISPTSEGGMLSAVMRTLEINLLHVSSVTKGASASVTIKVKNGTAWESLNLSGYKVYDQKYDDGADRLTITCYDSMLLSMVPYDLNLTYPKTVKQLLQAICSRLGYSLGTSTFPNSAKSLAADPFIGIGYTFRDALTEIAQAAGRTIVLVGSSLRLVQITDTGFSIAPNNLRSLTVGEHIGPINSIVLARTPQEDNVYLRDETSVTANGLHEYRIENNLLMDSDRSSFLPAILSELNGLEYDAIELNTYGLPWLDACDGIHVTDMDGNRHYVAVFNNSCSIGKGITGSLKTDPPSATKTDYKTAAKTDKAIRRTELIVDKQAGQIAGIVEDMRDLDETLSSRITQTADAITAEVTRATAAEGMLQSSISQQADQILMTVQKLENIGGRNLIINTMEPGEDPDVRPRLLKQSVGTRAVPSDAQCKVYASDLERHGFRFVLTTPGQLIIYFGDTFSNATMNGLEAGKTYTVSGKVYRKLLSNYSGSAEYVVRCILRTDDGGGNDWVTSASKDIATVTPGQDLTKDFTWTFTVPTGVTKTQIAVFCNDNTASDYAVGDFIALRYLKLETGEVATAWTPAPEDHADYADAKFQIAADAITAEVTRATAAEGTLQSSISQQADQIEMAVQKLDSIGTRNLIINTLSPDASLEKRPRILSQPVPTKVRSGTVTAATHGMRVTLTSGTQPAIYFGDNTLADATLNGLEAGTTYTISGWGGGRMLSNYTGSSEYYTRVAVRTAAEGDTEWTTLGNHNIRAVTPGQGKKARFVWTFTLPTNATKMCLLFYCNDSTAADYAAGDYLEISSIKLEKGEVATAWTPAPEDQVGNDEIISKINISPEQITIQANRISLAGKTIDLTSDTIEIRSNNFNVTSAGVLTATGANISGTVTATAGEIGGFTIDSTSIRSAALTSTSAGAIALSTEAFERTINGTSRTLRMAIGSKFGVTSSGVLYAADVDITGTINSSNATISGTITTSALTATGGTVGGWDISGTQLQKLSAITEGSASTQYRAFIQSNTGSNGGNRAFSVAKREYTGSSYGAWTYPFHVKYDGSLYAENAEIHGSVTATSGHIGRYEISSTYLRAYGTDGDNSTCVGIGGNQAFWAGSNSSSSAPFRVSYSGALVATNAIISGKITATSGSIDGSLVTSGISAAHITAGTLSTDRLAAGSIKAAKLDISDIFAQSITASNFNITGGSVDITTSSQSTSKIKLTGNGYATSIAAEGITLTSSNGTIFIGDKTSYGLLNVAGKFQITAGNGITNAITENGNLANTGLLQSASISTFVACSNNTGTNLTSISLVAGKWVVSGAVTFASNATGYRRITLTTTSGASSSGFANATRAVSDAATYMTTTGVFNLTGTTRVYLAGIQNSGSSINVTAASITAVRII